GRARWWGGWTNGGCAARGTPRHRAVGAAIAEALASPGGSIAGDEGHGGPRPDRGSARPRRRPPVRPADRARRRGDARPAGRAHRGRTASRLGTRRRPWLFGPG